MSKPKNIKEAAAELSKFESFDTDVFKGDHKTSQELCNFIVALALFCNDLKSIVIFNTISNEYAPKDMENVSPELAQYLGLMMHFERLYASMINEFSEFLKKNHNVLKSGEFNEIIRLLPKENRQCWLDLIDVLFDKTDLKTNEFKSALREIRSNALFHYSSKEIGLGYVNHFVEIGNEPLISRGNSIGEIRFYFADAAGQSHFTKVLKKRNQDNYSSILNDIIKNILMSAYLVVEKFINTKSGFKEPTIIKISEIKFKK